MTVKADGKPGGATAEVQFNDRNGFGGDAGLTYADRQLVITGNEDKATPLLLARSGDFHATAIAETFVPDADVLYTAVAPGPGGNDITVTYTYLGADQPAITITVVGTAITIFMATDSGSAILSTANDVIAAVNADIDASALIVASLAPLNDGSGVVGFATAQLFGGALAADTAWIDERGVLNVQLQTGLGEFAVKVRDTDGNVVAHIDNDGGFSFSSERIQAAQNGVFSVNASQAVPLTGNAVFQFKINDYSLFTIGAGGGYCYTIGSPDPDDIVLTVYAYTDQTGDLINARNANDEKVFRVLANGEIQIDKPELGVILIDRTTGDRWRQFIDNGVPGWELV